MASSSQQIEIDDFREALRKIPLDCDHFPIDFEADGNFAIKNFDALPLSYRPAATCVSASQNEVSGNCVDLLAYLKQQGVVHGWKLVKNRGDRAIVRAHVTFAPEGTDHNPQWERNLGLSCIVKIEYEPPPQESAVSQTYTVSRQDLCEQIDHHFAVPILDVSEWQDLDLCQRFD